MKKLIYLALFCAVYVPAFAADKKPVKPAPEPPPVAERPPAQFEPELLQLSELMGSLSFLADLCPDKTNVGQNGALWREKTTNLIDAEATGPRLKGLLAGAYNRGFTSLEINYKSCTDAAQALYSYDIEAVHKLSQSLARRFNGN